MQQAFKNALVVLKLNDKVSTKLGDKVNEHLQEFFMKIGGGVNENGQQTRGDFAETHSCVQSLSRSRGALTCIRMC